MVTFEVNDMTCGHCASTIAKALATVDKSARIEVDIPRKLVRVSGQRPAADLAKAIQDTGYTPREVQTELAPSAAPRAASGCGCGSRKAHAVEIGQAAAAAGRSCCG